jgi:lysophospholipase L1-like esterase
MPDPSPAQNPYEPEIRFYEKADKANPPPKGCIVFVGSSSIRLWESMARDFPGVACVNRGFGGSTIGDSVHFADRIITSYGPGKVVFYAGDNDLGRDMSVDQVFDDYAALVAKIHAALPKTLIAFISVKPSLSRWHLIEPIRALNARVRACTAADPRLRYIDIDAAMLLADGTPNPALYVEDGLHMTAAGYAVWAKAVRPFVLDEDA